MSFPITRRPTARASAVIVTLTVGLVAAGCSDDNEPADASGDAGTAAAYCDTALVLAADPGPDVDFATASEDDVSVAVRTWAGGTMLPRVGDLEEVVPPQLEDDLQVFRDALEHAADTGDGSGFDSPELDAADAAAHAHDLEHCGWTTAQVVASDYEFSGLDATYPAGPLDFELANDGPEVHELTVLRIQDGVGATVEELMSSDDPTDQAKFEMINSTGPVESGDDEYLVVDLGPGRYVVTCFVPQGATSMEAMEHTVENAPAHAAIGMVHEFTIG